MRKIWDEGYSTKGKNRGLGLTSYQQILSKYQNVTKQTTLENGYFTQMLWIAKH